MPPKLARLAGLGALAAAAGLLALIALFAFATRPGEFAGMDATHRTLSWLSVAGILVALAAVHVVLGRQLLAAGRGERQAP